MAREDGTDDIPRERNEPRPDFSQPVPRKKLPKSLQKIIDNEDKQIGHIYEGTAAESTDSNIRYAAYATRIRTILLSAHRYVAYTSDIGESFRPVAHPYLVKGAYGISWAYLAGDVAHEGYKAYLRNQRALHPETPDEGPLSDQKQNVEGITTSLGPGLTDITLGAQGPTKIPWIDDYRTVMAQRAIFQSVASMGLPAFTIHSVVRYSGRALKNAKNTKIRTYGPIGLGLAVVPFLPFIFDKPVEEAVEWTFHKAFSMYSGEEAVNARAEADRTKLLIQEGKQGVSKEKEL
ncbi:hypothetical protein L228DRAFT_244329 [Xylona heveae TC161]|uniref:Mitochondrial fission process protein 1 n=1 Tax=Xylona heveae (strain CBS 132557 / TC161) TaxID=1328760 RepID=A0A165IWS0_XYLHT|nr:hypothetical protein L228DRAFT_244329 [Xylona heveae TC161]KZF25482.1 hypothetical protein L228DRAFT_244329 [Xylona heveae TC161]